MYFRQFYLGCLAHASYLIGSGGEAAVVDPQRDVDIYLEDAAGQGLRILHVIETHLHADFVSGHRELARRTGAGIYFGAGSGARFNHVAVRDGDEIRVGSVLLRFLQTPGHTPESISVLVIDTDNSPEPEAVLTGDTLFIGDVGRPDLAGARMAPEELAGLLYDSLHRKLLSLPDRVKVFPAHGAGSLCGRNISNEKSSTIGHERQFNYALRPMSKEEFVRLMTVDLPEAPPYFKIDAEINRSGPEPLEGLPAPVPLAPAAAMAALNQGAVLLDTRAAAEFGAGHIPGALHIGLAGQFASWCGTILEPATSIIVIAEDQERVREARTRLARVGLENVAGFLDGSILAWSLAGLPLTTTEQIGVDELSARLNEPDPPMILDVRRAAEWTAGHIAQAVHMPLPSLRDRARQLNRDSALIVICAGGYRSSIATSILEQQGFRSVTNTVGGMAAWTAAGHATV
jgi:glyoxylase-like metal-dependent hydrolase (beta-lactamase superfamily II)/rhodanese-related sulfurtransferase